jgi:uncharacterized protein
MERDFIEYVAKSLVDDPAAVEVNLVEADEGTVIELRVAQDDIGKVIGKRGRIAKAIRTLLSATATRESAGRGGKDIKLQILD